MKINKKFIKFQQLFDDDSRARNEHRKDLKRLLQKMKTKEKNLQEKLDSETSQETRKVLQGKINTLHAQRKKGLRILRTLKR